MCQIMCSVAKVRFKAYLWVILLILSFYFYQNSQNLGFPTIPNRTHMFPSSKHFMESDFFKRGWWPFLRGFLRGLGSEIMEEIHYVEQFFINMKGLYAFISQVCFFVLIHSILENNGDFRDEKSDKSVIMALTSILFYSVFSYFVSRVRDIFQRHRIQIFRHFLTFDQLVQWIFKVILEWAKAVVIVLCLREQGIKYQPTIMYSIITFIYYLCSEKIYVETFPELLELVNIECLENLEHLYVPMVLNFIAIFAGIAATSYILLIEVSNFVILCLYFLVYIRLKDVYHNNWRVLTIEKETFKSFRVATQEEIETWNDICAVCLNEMSRARITPCNHLFHPYCLKQCLKSSLLCPLCKRHFLEHNSDIKL